MLVFNHLFLSFSPFLSSLLFLLSQDSSGPHSTARERERDREREALRPPPNNSCVQALLWEASITPSTYLFLYFSLSYACLSSLSFFLFLFLCISLSLSFISLSLILSSLSFFFIYMYLSSSVCLSSVRPSVRPSLPLLFNLYSAFYTLVLLVYVAVPAGTCTSVCGAQVVCVCVCVCVCVGS